MRFISFFAGIGGIDLGLERAGHTCVGQCEIDPFCCKVLTKHWPDTPRWGDIRELAGDELPGADLWTAGFPCQDISNAGKRVGIHGTRSGLFFDLMRLVRAVEPRYILLENVSALLTRGMGTVLGELAEGGYDAEWNVVSAADVGAPHLRRRVFILANAQRPRLEKRRALRRDLAEECQTVERSCVAMANASIVGPRKAGHADCPQRTEGGPSTQPDGGGGDVADADSQRQPQPQGPEPQERGRIGDGGEEVPDAIRPLCESGPGRRGIRESGSAIDGGQWAVEPDVGRVVARVSVRLDRGRLDGAPTQGGTRKILLYLRDSFGTKADEGQWTVGGLGGIQAEEALLAKVCEYTGPSDSLGNVSLQGKETSQDIMRSVWIDGTLTCPSCRRKAREQRTAEHPNALRLLSQLLTCDCGAVWIDGAGTPSACSRVDRLRALGNAVVPQVAEYIGRILAEAENG